MWFDPHAKLAEIVGQPPATSATPATNALPSDFVSQLSQVSQRPAPETVRPHVANVATVAAPLDPAVIIDLLEERAAIREYDGCQTRAEAEAGAIADVSTSTATNLETVQDIWQAWTR